MRPRYLLDTNMCIYLMKHQPAKVATRFAQCYVGEVVMSAVTMAELEHGVSCSGVNEHRNREALHELVQDIPPEPFDHAAARAYGPIRLASSTEAVTPWTSLSPPTPSPST